MFNTELWEQGRKQTNNIMKIKDFTDKLLEEFEKEITDQVFIYIESNRELMHDYLLTVTEQTELKVVNSQIAQAIGKRYGLTTNGIKNQNPKSKLIQGYEEFESNKSK
jgi:hypothetical protein